MATGRSILCWDACVFISLLTGEGRTPDQMAKLKALEAVIDNGEVTIFTSALAIVEVFECDLSDEQKTRFHTYISTPKCPPQYVDTRVAKLAREVREFYSKAHGMDVATPDAIYIATASIFGASVLQTYDGCGKRKRKNDLLVLPDVPERFGIHIEIPDVPMSHREPVPRLLQAMAGAVPPPENTKG
jgi:hypothetical protein